MYKVKLWLVRATIFVMKKQQLIQFLFLYAAFNNIKVFNVAMGKQQWFPFCTAI